VGSNPTRRIKSFVFKPPRLNAVHLSAPFGRRLNRGGSVFVPERHSLRVGSYRIIYQLADNDKTVRVATIRHRGVAYGSGPR
jgi:mRNA-degrading endonuclease RelE of RelBE toxin-antitoxin system